MHPTLQSRISRRTLAYAALASAAGIASIRPAIASSRQGHAPIQIADDEDGENAIEKLNDLLSFIPAKMVEGSDAASIGWHYADLAKHFAALGLDIAGADLSGLPLVGATSGPAFGGSVFQFVVDEGLMAAIGFQPFAMRQTLFAGDPPNQINLFRGDFDAEALISAWTESGYDPLETRSGETVWSIGSDGEIDLNHPIQRRLLSSFNNAVIVDDVMVFTPNMATLEVVLAANAGSVPSTATSDVLAPLVSALPGTIASAVAVTSLASALDPGLVDAELAEATQEELAAIEDDLGPMPPMGGMVMALEAGAAPLDLPLADGTSREDAGTVFYRFATQSEEDAESAVEIALRRWEELDSLSLELPYTELMTPLDQGVDGTTAMLDFVQIANPRTWVNMLFQRDMVPFLPSAEE